ncbi:cyclic AMP response element-binding protein A isoform X2 [Chelonus insularis]|nr:cyclic AMP response element-binding protein A isoform X2 [Chelonus insularis]
MASKDEEWGNILGVKDKMTLDVVLRDRLMTDAALGGPKPIKTEHSYSLLAYSPPASPATSEDHSNTQHSCSMKVNNKTSSTVPENHREYTLPTRIDDMEEECFPAISMNKASSHGRVSSSTLSMTSSDIITSKTSIKMDEDIVEIKREPTYSLSSPVYEQTNSVDNKSTIKVISPDRLHFTSNHMSHTSDSEADDEEYYENADLEELETQLENEIPSSSQGLPPTPPSSASSDSESTVSASCSPVRRNSQNSGQNIHEVCGSRLYTASGQTHSARQPIHTSLISCQPKGSTGVLVLTEEEKRTLIAEGYPVPTKLPLTKQEEKSLKKVRRKIKNKISAQESRRKKKEYMDGLERRVTMLTNENFSYKSRLSTLEDTNRELLKELERLQALVERQSS